MIKNKINLTQSAINPSKNDIKEAFDNMVFPGLQDIILFYGKSNGGVPDKNALSGDYNSTIRYLLPVKSKLPINIESIEETRKFYRSRKDVSNFFIKNVPFSIDDGGNLHCVDLEYGKIYYVPMDSGSDLHKEKVLVAKEFGIFINNLDFFEKVFGE